MGLTSVFVLLGQLLSWGPIVCRPKDERQGRRLQDDCLFSKDHPDSPCSACEAYFASGDEMEACEEAVGKYCTDNYEDDVIACKYAKVLCC